MVKKVACLTLFCVEKPEADPVSWRNAFPFWERSPSTLELGVLDVSELR